MDHGPCSKESMISGVDHAPAANLQRLVQDVVPAALEVLREPLVPVVLPVQGRLEAAGRCPGHGQLLDHHWDA